MLTEQDFINDLNSGYDPYYNPYVYSAEDKLKDTCSMNFKTYKSWVNRYGNIKVIDLIKILRSVY